MLLHKSFLLRPKAREKGRKRRRRRKQERLFTIAPHSPVEFTISVLVDVLGEADDNASNSAANSSESAFTLLRWTDSRRNSIAKNRKPSCALQLRLRRFVFRLLGGPMMCCCCCCALRVFLRFWIFTSCFFYLEFFLNFSTFLLLESGLRVCVCVFVCESVFAAATFSLRTLPQKPRLTLDFFFFLARESFLSFLFLSTFLSFQSRAEESLSSVFIMRFLAVSFG